MNPEEEYEKWWRTQTLKGDPARNPNLVKEAFLAAFQLGMEWQQELSSYEF